MLFALCLAALGTLGACSHDDNDISKPTPGIALTPGLIPGAWTDGNTAGTRADQSTGITFAPGGEIVVKMYAKGGDANDAQQNTFEINADGKMERKAYVPGSGDNEADLNVPDVGDYHFIVLGYAQCLLADGAVSAGLPMKAWLCTAGAGGEDNVFTVAANGNVSIACALSTAGIKLQMLTPDGNSAYTQGGITATPAAALRDLNGVVIASVSIGDTGLAAWGDIEATVIDQGAEVMHLAVGGTNYKVLAPASLNLIAGRLITLKVRVGATGITVEMENSNGGILEFVAEAEANAEAEAIPPGTHTIDSPEALAQFAHDVNDDPDGGATFVAYQTVDLDMSLLKPAATAGTNPLTGSAYTYTATKDNWVPIGYEHNSFNNAYQGQYNGNGHTISNVKIVAAANSSNERVGFFGLLDGATLTGIHLRGISITDLKAGDVASCGALASWVTEGCTISGCSATGTIALTSAYELGGLIGTSGAIFGSGAGAGTTNAITRCSASVNVYVDKKVDDFSYLYIGGFVGNMDGTQIAGCSSVSTITLGSDASTAAALGAGGFVGACMTVANSLIGCYSGGTISSGGFGFCGMLDGISLTAIGCYSDVTGGGNFINTTDYNAGNHSFTDCAYANADGSSTPGIEGGVAAAAAYSKLTATNATLANVKTLHWSVAAGYTLTPVTKTWSTKGIWQDNTGALPTINLAYEGE